MKLLILILVLFLVSCTTNKFYQKEVHTPKAKYGTLR